MASKPRSIFEDVSDVAKPIAAPGGIDAGGKGARAAIRVWLMALFALVVVLICVGGLTRLTDSGLSITEWKPLSGSIPPMDAAAWDAEFVAYQQIPEYIEQNAGMSLEEFKVIYWWEWGHRQLARFIGLVWAVGFAWFYLRKQIPVGWSGRLLLVGALGGTQAAVGWWMVSSGLEHDRVDVSQYRLATHLGLAFIVLGLLFWTWRDQRDGWKRFGSKRVLAKSSMLLAGLVYLQLLSGAFVAGTHSGKSYNTWPLMDGGLMPSGYGAREPFWRNLFENPAAIQFNHRTLAYVILVVALWVAWRSTRAQRPAIIMLLVLLFWQVGLGVWTLLAVAPLSLSLLHQFSSILVFLAGMNVLWRSRNTVK